MLTVALSPGAVDLYNPAPEVHTPDEYSVALGERSGDLPLWSWRGRVRYFYSREVLPDPRDPGSRGRRLPCGPLRSDPL